MELLALLCPSSIASRAVRHLAQAPVRVLVLLVAIMASAMASRATAASDTALAEATAGGLAATASSGVEASSRLVGLLVFNGGSGFSLKLGGFKLQGVGLSSISPWFSLIHSGFARG